MFDWFADWQNVLGAALLAPFVLGAAVVVIEALKQPKPPSDADVQHAAAQYREFYKDRALDAIGDHMLAATFAPSGAYRRFLKRVCEELLRDV